MNLCAGLDRIGIGYRSNDYRYALRHPEELACIIGGPVVLDRLPWRNPILFGASVFTHPIQDPRLFERRPVKRVLVPGEWMRRMWEPYYGDWVSVWPVGIDSDLWVPAPAGEKQFDFLIYDKIRWDHEKLEPVVLEPIRAELRRRGLSFMEIRYGHYQEDDYRCALGQCKAMIFLCEHETQGIAYQQALSAGVPLLAWDRGGVCCDPFLLEAGVRFGPVSTVPYWDDRCGCTFVSVQNFAEKLEEFQTRHAGGGFDPRSYIVENLTLERCAQDYLEIVRRVEGDLGPPALNATPP